jgi:GTP-binding protein HflX
VILSDTVGFISDLPHELVDSFRATLDEVREADIILHVRDIAAADSDAEAADVEKVLGGLGIGPESGRRVIEVWNKIDLLNGSASAEIGDQARRAGALTVSATTGEGFTLLLERLSQLVDDAPELVFELAASDGEALAWLYRHGRVTHREERAGATFVSARLDTQALGQFERLRPLSPGRGVSP